MNFDCTKYKRANFQPKNFKDRQWPDKEITKAPIWCSVDLRDGNQSLPIPMNVDEKIKMFNMLLEVGFKEIEIGFPSASQTEYDFLRKLIDEDLIPDDVTIQVLTQSREHLIVKTFESLKGCKKAIVHLYNSTSILQREVVFHKSKDEIMDIAVKGAEIFNREAKKYPQTKFQYEYSPESFTGTEMDYALEICEAVMDVWKPTSDNKMIINLPSTVEMTTPNLYADQIEWFSRNIKHRDCVTISLHTHNDRGTSVAACELGILAGADRIEGTLFGNGERTGNLDIITVAMNMYSSGIDPKLDFSNILKITDIYKINSQSGKGGAIYIMENEFGFNIPKNMHKYFGKVVKEASDKMGKELSPQEIYDLFKEWYIDIATPYRLKKYKINSVNSDVYDIKNCAENNILELEAIINFEGKDYIIKGQGNGPIDAFNNALKQKELKNYKFKNYYEHALSDGSHAKGVAYVEIEDKGEPYFGVGISENINTAAINALMNAINKSYMKMII